MPGAIALLFHLLLCSLFFFCLCTLIYVLNLPQQHTIHVVVSCFFFPQSWSFVFAVVLPSPQASFAVSGSKVSSQITWMFPQTNEAEIHNGSLYADRRARKTSALQLFICVTIKSDVLFTRGDFLFRNHLSLISQRNWWPPTTEWINGNLLPLCDRSKFSDCISPLAVAFFLCQSSFPSSWADGLLLVKGQRVCGVKCHFFSI